jgi:hypothetical protein
MAADCPHFQPGDRVEAQPGCPYVGVCPGDQFIVLFDAYEDYTPQFVYVRMPIGMPRWFLARHFRLARPRRTHRRSSV